MSRVTSATLQPAGNGPEVGVGRAGAQVPALAVAAAEAAVVTVAVAGRDAAARAAGVVVAPCGAVAAALGQVSVVASGAGRPAHAARRRPSAASTARALFAIVS